MAKTEYDRRRAQTPERKAYMKACGRRIYLENTEAIKKRSKEYRERNKERCAARNKAWRLAHPDKMAAYRKRWLSVNSERFVGMHKEWRRTPKGRAYLRRRDATRRACMASAIKENFDSIEIFERDGWVCKNCGCETPRELIGELQFNRCLNQPTLDHVVPLAKGGDHTRANSQLLCRRCNSSKNDRSMERADASKASKPATAPPFKVAKPDDSAKPAP